MNTVPYDLVIGLDRSDRKADLHLIRVADQHRYSQTIDTSPEALWEWLLQLRQDYPQGRIALCLEQPAVHLIAYLEAYEWITLYPINPLTLQKYREAFVTSRAKDDTKDARYLAELLLSHHDKLKAWAPEHEPTRGIQQFVFHRRSVVNERVGLTNRLKDLLKQYFPQALVLCGEDLWRPLATRFLLKWPSLQAVQKAKTEKLKEFYYLNGSRSAKLMEQRLSLIDKAVPVTDQTVVLQSFILRVQLLCRQLQDVVTTIKTFDLRITEAFKEHGDYQIFSSLPGAGPVLAPRLLATMGSQRDRFESAANLQNYTGIAPVTKQSGGKCYVHRRYLCPKFHRQSFHEYAQESILWSRWAAAFYLQQRTKGCYHHATVRALAYKWQRIIWRCWQSRKPYEQNTYEAALRKAKSPLVKLFDQVELGKSPLKNKVNKN
jgi:transposase